MFPKKDFVLLAGIIQNYYRPSFEKRVSLSHLNRYKVRKYRMSFFSSIEFIKEFDSWINKKVNPKISINISELLTEDRSQTPGKGNLRGNSHHNRVANMLSLTKSTAGSQLQIYFKPCSARAIFHVSFEFIRTFRCAFVIRTFINTFRKIVTWQILALQVVRVGRRVATTFWG